MQLVCSALCAMWILLGKEKGAIFHVYYSFLTDLIQKLYYCYCSFTTLLRCCACCCILSFLLVFCPQFITITTLICILKWFFTGTPLAYVNSCSHLTKLSGFFDWLGFCCCFLEEKRRCSRHPSAIKILFKTMKNGKIHVKIVNSLTILMLQKLSPNTLS